MISAFAFFFCNKIVLLLLPEETQHVSRYSGFEPVVLNCALSGGLFRQINSPPTSLPVVAMMGAVQYT